MIRSAFLRLDIASVGVGLLITLSMGAVAAWPHFSDAQEDARMQDTRAAQLKLETRAAETMVLAAQRELADMSTRLQRVSRIDRADRVNQRLADLTERAESAGLLLNQLTPGPGLTDRQFVVVPMTVSGSGTYTDITQFLRTMHTRSGDIALRSLKLTGVPSTEPQPLNLHAEFAWFALPSAAPGSSSSTDARGQGSTARESRP